MVPFAYTEVGDVCGRIDRLHLRTAEVQASIATYGLGARLVMTKGHLINLKGAEQTRVFLRCGVLSFVAHPAIDHVLIT